MGDELYYEAESGSLRYGRAEMMQERRARDREEAFVTFRAGWLSACPNDADADIRAAFDTWYPA